eukprot:PLAT11667.1.p2 GENE.PLAT11667.1~~PLAT11667.1.p2  ORF type:complete len:544 (+),score=315.12 PLAT11667.1:66-1697(+)
MPGGAHGGRSSRSGGRKSGGSARAGGGSGRSSRGGASSAAGRPAGAGSGTAGAGAVSVGARLAAEQMEFLQLQGDLYTKKIEMEKRRIEELEKKLARSRESVMAARRNLKQGKPSTLSSRQRVLRTLENRLEKMLVKLNESVTQNKSLRTSIESLRREKMQHEAIRRKLAKEVRGLKTETADACDRTAEAHAARDEALAKIDELKALMSREVEEFELEWKQRVAELESDREASREMAKRRGAAKEELDLREKTAIAREIDMKHRSTKAYWTIAKKEADLKRQTEKVQTYEEAFAKIQKETGIESIEEMVNAFIEAEEKNFTLFNVINELNSEIETLELENNEIRSNIEKYKGKGQYSEENRKRICQTLEEQIRKVSEKASHFEERYAESLKMINSMKDGIERVFIKVGCSDEAMEQQLKSTGVTETNIMQFLGIIEQRIGEIVQMHNLAVHPDASAGSPAIGRSVERTPARLAGPTRDMLDDLKILEDEDDEDDGLRPLRPRDIKDRIGEWMGKRRMAADSRGRGGGGGSAGGGSAAVGSSAD